MRFPHLYGPLPATAVVAVVPYRPPVPPVLPDPGDARGRALAFFTSLPVRRAVGVGDVPGGVAVLDPDLPHSWDNNRLVLTEPVDAATIETAADVVAGNAGWRRQAAALFWPDAAGTAADLAGAAGTPRNSCSWRARPARSPAAERADVVDQREVHDFWAASWRRAPGRRTATGRRGGAAGRPRAPQRPGRRGQPTSSSVRTAGSSPPASSAWTARPPPSTRC